MSKPFSRFKKTVIIASAAALAFVGAGVAYAYWTSTGQGDGQAQTGEAVEFTITTNEDTFGVLAPGSDGQTLGFTVLNPGPGSLHLEEVTVTIADEEGVAWIPPAGCLIADYTVEISTPPETGTLEALDSVTGIATVTLANTGLNQDACKGQTVPLHFEAWSASQ